MARALAISLERERREAARLDREQNLAMRLDALRRFVYDRFGMEIQETNGDTLGVLNERQLLTPPG